MTQKLQMKKVTETAKVKHISVNYKFKYLTSVSVIISQNADILASSRFFPFSIVHVSFGN